MPVFPRRVNSSCRGRCYGEWHPDRAFLLQLGRGLSPAPGPSLHAPGDPIHRAPASMHSSMLVGWPEGFRGEKAPQFLCQQSPGSVGPESIKAVSWWGWASLRREKREGSYSATGQMDSWEHTLLFLGASSNFNTIVHTGFIPYLKSWRRRTGGNWYKAALGGDGGAEKGHLLVLVRLLGSISHLPLLAKWPCIR